MREKVSIRKVGGSLYVRIPYWFTQIRHLRPGDFIVWKLDDELLETDSEIRLQFEKATKEEVAA
jgi:hypothetical protein